MTSTKGAVEIKEVDNQMTDGKNVTPQISVKTPGKSLKDFISMVTQFVSVGGDFV